MTRKRFVKIQGRYFITLNNTIIIHIYVLANGDSENSLIENRTPRKHKTMASKQTYINDQNENEVITCSREYKLYTVILLLNAINGKQ